MSQTLDPTIRELNDCGCCEGLGLAAPEVIDNRPGLSAIAYRIGTHSRFKTSMLARLSSADLPALNDLTTRSDADFTIALLDAWAAVADVLTFYQERIANESYLRTAIERRSLVELGNLIGYVPRPGVAASTYLAFTLDDTGLVGDVPVPAGTRVQSIPGPGEKPQVFETIEAIAGRTDWNAMKPRLLQKHPTLTKETKVVTVRGIAANVEKGDSILLVVCNSTVVGNCTTDRELKRVLNVVTDTEAQTTRIELAADPPNALPFFFQLLPPASWQAKPVKLTTTSVTNNVLGGSWKQANLKAYAFVQSWPIKKLSVNLQFLAKAALKLQLPVDQGVFALRQHASIFGHNAPAYSSLPATQRFTDYVTASDGTLQPKAPPYPDSWEDKRLSQEPGGPTKEIDLDTTYPSIVKGSWLVLESSSKRSVYKVEDNTELSRSDYTLTGKVSRIKLDNTATDLNSFGLRDTSVLSQSEKLELAELPITDPVKGNKIVLDGPYIGLVEGRPVAVSGRRTDLDGVVDSEVMFLADVVFSEGYTELTFVNALAHEYERATVTVNANVALATHGETRQQALGSGDARAPFQRFLLPESPLTYVPARNIQGMASTLEVRVNELRWQEVDFLHGRGPDDQVYITRTDDEGRTIVQFGDGQTGSRLPTGQENVQAAYRKGIGPEGLVDEAQLTLLLTKPLGVRGVTNPVAAGDAADPESRDDVRRNAPLPIRSLSRIVSLRDYEDFARAFPSVAKALATWTWNGHEQGVFVTVAGTGGKAIADDSLTYENLLAAMLQAGDPMVPLRVKSYKPVFFRLAADVSVDPAYLPEKVLPAVETALRAAFGFDARAFGQPVAKSEVIAAIQAVSGVRAVDLNELHRIDLTEKELAAKKLYDILPAQAPRGGSDVTVGAELLLLDPRPVQLGRMTA